MTAEPQDMNTLDDDTFRIAVRAWIEANYPPELRNPPKRLHWSECGVWYKKLAEKGWLCPAWPKEYGGMGLTPAKQIIMIEELERHGCARTVDQGVLMVGPLIIARGSQAQKDTYLPKILSGEHVWCQGYSEPNAGSDLASLRTRADLDGDTYVINGQKIWTSMAMDANMIYVLARTNSKAKKQDGISFFLVPMDTPGITVRPLVNLDLNEEFCEVFFDDVRVPAENLVGQPDKGWSMAKDLLGFERIFVGAPKQAAYALATLEAVAERLDLTEGSADAINRHHMDIADLADLYETYLDQLRRGEVPGPDVSMLKIYQTELFQRISEDGLALAGDFGASLEPMDGNRALNPAAQFLHARPSTIYSGTNEIQRNILSKNVLELPG
ncbi:MAG: acyl-CoA dehydrogenase family protein [Acetobacteraceae bacterium]